MQGNYELYARLRDSKGLTDNKVAKLTGIPQTTIANWKRKGNIQRIDRLMELANFFEVPLEELIQN